MDQAKKAFSDNCEHKGCDIVLMGRSPFDFSGHLSCSEPIIPLNNQSDISRSVFGIIYISFMGRVSILKNVFYLLRKIRELDKGCDSVK